MKRQKTFERTVATLVKAYFNETLHHGSPCACAIGNMIRERKEPSGWWYHFLYRGKVLSSCSLSNELAKGEADLSVLEYSHEEIIRIERAFESVRYTRNKFNPFLDEDGYLGLMAVLDVLFDIHKVSDNHKHYRQMFVKAEK